MLPRSSCRSHPHRRLRTRYATDHTINSAFPSMASSPMAEKSSNPKPSTVRLQVQVEHVRIEAAKPFAEVKAALEDLVPPLDPTVTEALRQGDIRRAKEALQGSASALERSRNEPPKFAADSPLEGDGFELSVPGREPVRGRRDSSLENESEFCGGTEGSNPSPSSGESAANSILDGRASLFGRHPRSAHSQRHRIDLSGRSRFSQT